MDGFFGMSGDEIYRNFTEAVGGGDLSSAGDIARELRDEHEQDAQEIRSLAVLMESAWRGDAGDAAQRGAVPLAAEHEMSAPLLFTDHDLFSRQVGSFDDAKNRVVPVPPAPEKPPGMGILFQPGALPTYQRQLDEHNAAADHNVDIMTSYEGASEYNRDNLPASYGSLTPDSAGVAVATSQDDASGPRSGDDGGPGGPRGDGGRGPGGSSWLPPAQAGGPGSPSEGPSAPTGGGGGGLPPQTTTPGGYVPPAPVPAPSPGPGPGPGVPAGVGGGSAWPGGGGGPLPGGGFVPGGGVGFGSGPGEGGSGAGPGARGVGGSTGGPGGAGGRPGAGGEGGHGVGGRPGLAPGGAAAEAAARGPAGARGSAAGGGMPFGAGAGRGQGGEDEEHQRKTFMEGGDPEDLFGTGEMTAPPVIGEED